MATEFLKAAQALVYANAQFAARTLSPVAHRDAREPAIAGALVAMAAEMGVTLQTPLYVDSNGEFSLNAMHPDGRQPTMGCGEFGEAFSAALTKHQARMGVNPGLIDPVNGWCRLNHFGAERMVLEYLESQSQTEDDSAPSGRDTNRGG